MPTRRNRGFYCRSYCFFFLFIYGRHHDVLVEYLKITKNALTSSTTSFII